MYPRRSEVFCDFMQCLVVNLAKTSSPKNPPLALVH